MLAELDGGLEISLLQVGKDGFDDGEFALVSPFCAPLLHFLHCVCCFVVWLVRCLTWGVYACACVCVCVCLGSVEILSLLDVAFKASDKKLQSAETQEKSKA